MRSLSVLPLGMYCFAWLRLPALPNRCQPSTLLTACEATNEGIVFARCRVKRKSELRSIIFTDVSALRVAFLSHDARWRMMCVGA